MGNRSAAHFGPAETRAPANDTASAFQRELEQARRHLARLEAEALRRQQPIVDEHHVHFDESPAVARTCNVLIMAIVAAPFVLALVMVARRLLG